MSTNKQHTLSLVRALRFRQRTSAAVRWGPTCCVCGKDGSYPLIFDGRPESWPFFKKALHQLLDKEGYGWVVEQPRMVRTFLKVHTWKVCTLRKVRTILGVSSGPCYKQPVQGGQEHRDIWKRHGLNKCRGLREEGPSSGVHKRVGNNIRTA